LSSQSDDLISRSLLIYISRSLLMYIRNCLGMASQSYNYHAQTDVSWICCTCGLPNFSTSLFESLIVDTSNVFDSLNVDEYNRQHNTPRFSTTYLLTKKRTKEQTRKPTTQFSYYITTMSDSNSEVEKFGSPQVQQIQLTSVCAW
jgi:hypothetical protein